MKHLRSATILSIILLSGCTQNLYEEYECTDDQFSLVVERAKILYEAQNTFTRLKYIEALIPGICERRDAPSSKEGER